MKYIFLITLFFLSFNSFAGLQPYNPERDNTEETDVSPLDVFGSLVNSIDESVKDFDDSLQESLEDDDSEKRQGPSNPYNN
jgi:hypothetical protein